MSGVICLLTESEGEVDDVVVQELPTVSSGLRRQREEDDELLTFDWKVSQSQGSSQDSQPSTCGRLLTEAYLLDYGIAAAAASASGVSSFYRPRYDCASNDSDDDDEEDEDDVIALVKSIKAEAPMRKKAKLTEEERFLKQAERELKAAENQRKLEERFLETQAKKEQKLAEKQSKEAEKRNLKTLKLSDQIRRGKSRTRELTAYTRESSSAFNTLNDMLVAEERNKVSMQVPKDTPHGLLYFTRNRSVVDEENLRIKVADEADIVPMCVIYMNGRNVVSSIVSNTGLEKLVEAGRAAQSFLERMGATSDVRVLFFVDGFDSALANNPLGPRMLDARLIQLANEHGMETVRFNLPEEAGLGMFEVFEEIERMPYRKKIDVLDAKKKHTKGVKRQALEDGIALTNTWTCMLKCVPRMGTKADRIVAKYPTMRCLFDALTAPDSDIQGVKSDIAEAAGSGQRVERSLANVLVQVLTSRNPDERLGEEA